MMKARRKIKAGWHKPDFLESESENQKE